MEHNILVLQLNAALLRSLNNIPLPCRELGCLIMPHYLLLFHNVIYMEINIKPDLNRPVLQIYPKHASLRFSLITIFFNWHTPEILLSLYVNSDTQTKRSPTINKLAAENVWVRKAQPFLWYIWTSEPNCSSSSSLRPQRRTLNVHGSIPGEDRAVKLWGFMPCHQKRRQTHKEGNKVPPLLQQVSDNQRTKQSAVIQLAWPRGSCCLILDWMDRGGSLSTCPTRPFSPNISRDRCLVPESQMEPSRKWSKD